MPRTKGSKNKPKIVEVTTPEEVVVVAPNTKKVAPAATTWEPKPDMGNVKPPEDSEKKCSCGCVKKLHYGGANDWCNKCNCQAWKP